ncbi:hypothetical protein SELMODRAFT_402524 [Selaginella moellendorffii]|uniref:non-specific serine/threonine protein kinase n=1 Tax=Selaginella moellendorffii TaxID=88036 RepID=D8QQY1_SELML|nr:hypothetical protein SELMODRAFT_402524 [Selaginella moellendorffii]
MDLDGSNRLLRLIAIFLSIVSAAHAFGYMSTMAALWGSGSSPVKSFSVCGIDASSGNPRCWGTFAINNASIPPANISLWSLTGGAYFACGLTLDGHNPVCWGQTPGSIVPAAFQGVRYSTINCGGWHVCAIRDKSILPGDEGRVDCWGNNDFGQCSPPITIPMRSITAGDYFSCGLTQYTGRVVCWGQMSGDHNDSAQRNRFNQRSLFDTIAAGRTHVCGILRKDHRALCWGANDHGQCSPPEGVAFSAISAGMFHTCGIRLDNHSAQCWGDDSVGQSSAPAGVAFSLITAGDRYTCGVRLDRDDHGGVECWGNQVAAPPDLGFNASQGVCVESSSCRSTQFELAPLVVVAGDNLTETAATTGCKICSPCATCGDGFYEAAACGQSRDTECSSCAACRFHEHDRCTKVCERYRRMGDDGRGSGRKKPAAVTAAKSSVKAAAVPFLAGKTTVMAVVILSLALF